MGDFEFIKNMPDDKFCNIVGAILKLHQNEIDSYEIEHERLILSEHVSFIISCFLAKHIDDGVETAFPIGYFPKVEKSFDEYVALAREMLKLRKDLS